MDVPGSGPVVRGGREAGQLEARIDTLTRWAAAAAGRLAAAGQLAPRSCYRQLRTLEARLSADMRTIVELLEHQPAHTTNTVQQPPRSQSQPSDVTVGSGSR